MRTGTIGMPLISAVSISIRTQSAASRMRGRPTLSATSQCGPTTANRTLHWSRTLRRCSRKSIPTGMESTSMKTLSLPKCCSSRSTIRPVIHFLSSRRYDTRIVGIDISGNMRCNLNQKQGYAKSVLSLVAAANSLGAPVALRGRQQGFGALLLPHLERLAERAFAGRTLFECEDGAAVVVVDHRDVEPGALLEQLQIPVAIGRAGVEPDEEVAIGDLGHESRQRRAGGLFARFHEDARHRRDTARWKVRRQFEHDFDRVAGRQIGIRVASERPGHGNVALGNFDVGADGE